MSKKLNFIGKTWKFNDNVAENFDKHVLQSVPHYADLQKYLVQLSEWFLKENCIIYDLGCSTGETINQILKLKITSKIRIIGIDNNKKMLELAKKKISKDRRKNININFMKFNLEKKFKFKKSNLIYSILLFPFLSFEHKKQILKNVFLSLNSEGALICVDKIRSKNSFFEDILNQLYFD
jgi:tRNA (cmo5U34)-methyltransferase